jgi:pseudouridine-5'-phosphate glycosidase
MWFGYIIFAAMDVSSDLTELGRTAVTVVCAGVKSILDIPRTLEYLVFSMNLVLLKCTFRCGLSSSGNV